jgi:hypothetical protein
MHALKTALVACGGQGVALSLYFAQISRILQIITGKVPTLGGCRVAS